MTVDLSKGFALVIGVLGLIALIAAAVAIAKSSYVKAQLEALRGDRDDLQQRVRIVEEDNVRISTDNEHLKTQVSDEVKKREALEKVVTGREQLDRISRLLEDRTQLFHDIQAHLDRIEQTVDDVKARLP